MDKSPGGSIRPRYLIYDVMQFEVNSSNSTQFNRNRIFHFAEKSRSSSV